MPKPIFFMRAVVFAMMGCLMAAAAATAQGIHFSQLINTPVLVSPANTGLISEDDYRVRVQYRNQWGAVPVPFNTFAVVADGQALRKSRVTNWLGLGAIILNDRAGEGSMGMTRIQLNAAFHLGLGKRQLLSAGFGVASIMRRVNISRLVFDAQWDGYAFNPDAPNMEPVQGSRAGYLDMSTGINYTFFPDKYTYLKGTISADHINSPVESIFRGGNVVKPRIHAMAEAGMMLSNGMLFTPTLYFTTQQKAWQALIGGTITMPLFDSKDSEALILGLHHRLRDAVVIMAGYEYKRLRLTASYDYTVSNLGQYISHNGAFEIGMGYRANYRRRAVAKNIEAPSSGEPPPPRLILR